jgi:hypothetical protein
MQCNWLSKLREGTGKLIHLLKLTSTHTFSNATLKIIHRRMPSAWVVRNDIANPFGDKRGNFRNVFTFDLNQDKLFFSGENECLQLPLD